MPPTLRRIRTVLQSHSDLIGTALEAASLTDANGAPLGGSIILDWPSPDELNAVKNGSPLICLMLVPPSKKSSTALRAPMYAGAANVPLIALSSMPVGSVARVDLSGSIIAGLNVHTIVGLPLVDVFTQTTDVDAAGTLTQFAQRIVDLVNNAAIPNVSAAVDGVGLKATGGTLRMNIGGHTTGYQETGRVNQRLQVTVWSETDDERDDIVEVITNIIGTTQRTKIALPDGTTATTLFGTGPMNTDEPVMNGMLKRATLFYQTDYANIRAVALTQVGGFSITTTLPNGNTVVSVEG